MLESEMAGVLGERQQKVVVRIVARAEELIGLLHESAVLGNLLLAHRQIRRMISDDVQMHGNVRAGGKIDTPEVDPGEQRRVDKRCEIDGLEMHLIARRARALVRRAESPPPQQLNARREFDAVRAIACWAEEYLITLPHRDARRHRGALTELPTSERRE